MVFNPLGPIDKELFVTADELEWEEKSLKGCYEKRLFTHPETGATISLYIRDMNQFDQIHAVRAEFFTQPYPACSMLEVSRMVSPESLIEIDAIAVLAD